MRIAIKRLISEVGGQKCYQILCAQTETHLGFTTEGFRGTRDDIPTCSYSLINGASGYGGRLDKFHVELPGEMKSTYFECQYEQDMSKYKAEMEEVLFTD